MRHLPCRTPAPTLSAATRLAVVVATAWCLGIAVAQAPRLAALELGFGGTLVADAWNPLRLTLRDVGPVDLEIVIDQGSLREGSVPLVYRATVRGGSGLSVFDDEVFVPTWRSLVWTARAGGITLASGSVPRADVDRRPLDLVVTQAPGPWRPRLGDGARVVDVTAERLVSRSAAYEGVRSVIVAGDGDPPRPGALVSAATAGAVVVLSDVAAQTPTLSALAPSDPLAWRRVGAGWIVQEGALEPGPAVLEAARTDHAATISAFAAVDRLQIPSSVPSITLLFAAAAYALSVLIVLRFGGTPGIVAAGALAVAASLVAWMALRPSDSTLHVTRDMVIGGGGGLGQRWRLHDVMSLPAADVRIDAAARPIMAIPLSTGPHGTTVSLARWRSQQLLERPRATESHLRWDADGVLVNDGPRPLTQVQVKDGASYGTLAPGAVAMDVTRDPLPPSATGRALLDVVPGGTAIGSDGTTWFVALADQPRRIDALGLAERSD
jgi:hypothetical protein